MGENVDDAPGGAEVLHVGGDEAREGEKVLGLVEPVVARSRQARGLPHAAKGAIFTPLSHPHRAALRFFCRRRPF